MSHPEPHAKGKSGVQTRSFTASTVRAAVRASSAEITQRQVMQPQRPSGGMCVAQRVDFLAACAGKITWKQYFAKWGRGGLSL